jgi:chromosome segregation ATPase
MYAVSGEEYAELMDTNKTINARCKHYREAYLELKAVNQQLIVSAAKDKQRALSKQKDELMLTHAQLMARNEECNKLRAQCAEQELELQMKRDALQAKDKALLEVGDAVTKIRQLNVAFMLEIRRLNAQLSAEGEINETSLKVVELSADLQLAHQQRNTYELALKIMQERICELEREQKSKVKCCK